MMNIKVHNLIIATILTGAAVGFTADSAPKAGKKKQQPATDFALRHNNPGLVTDLGVGLWGIPMPVDYDGDGIRDLVVSCPDRPCKGLWFFKNIGTPSEPLFAKGIKISAKGPNNIRLSEVDGKEYVLAKDVEYPDFFKAPFAKEQPIVYDGEQIGADYKKSRSNMWSYVDWDGDGDRDIVVGVDTWDDYGWDNAYDSEGRWTRGPLHGYVYLIENRDGKYVNTGKVFAGKKEMETFGAPVPCVADFDGDGDLDIICGEFVDGLTWYRNVGSRKKPKFEAGRQLVNKDGEIRFHIQMIVPVPVDFDGDGHMDLVVGDEDGRVAWLRNSGKAVKGMPQFESPRYFRQQADMVKFGALSTPFATDWDGDGLEDIVAGNSAGEIAFIRNLGGGDNPVWAEPQLFTVDGKPFRIQAGANGSIQGPAERKWGYTVLTVADWDGDGYKDIIINSIFGRIEWLRNKGGDDILDLEAPRPVEVAWEGEAPKPEWNWWKPEPGTLVTQWRTTPYATDRNGDGLCDLIVLDKDGYLAYFERFRDADGKLMLRPGKRVFHGTNCSVYDQKKGVVNANPGLLRLNEITAGWSGRRKICFMDWDGDGREDMIVDSKNAALFRNVKEENGETWFEYVGDLSDLTLAGHSTCPTPIHWNGQGTPEILLGAEDGHFYRIKNKSKKVPDGARLEHNNPGLKVKLGSGLWGIPLSYDYNNDGKKDILISCPDRPYKGLWYFENTGSVSEPEFAAAVRLSDQGINNVRLSEFGGKTYVLGSGVEYSDFFVCPFGNAKPLEYEGAKIGSEYKKVRHDTRQYVDYDGDGDADILAGIDTVDDYGWDETFDKDGNWTAGPLRGYVCLIENVDGKYVNRGHLRASDRRKGGKESDIETYGCSDPCMADFDGDGDLDLICGEFVDGLTWYENVGTRENPRFFGPRQLANKDGEIRFHVQFIVPTLSDFDGDGLPDLIVADEDGSVAWVRNTGVVKNHMPQFESPRYFMQQAGPVKFGALSTPCAFDWDGDGREDIVSGNSAGEIVLFRNLGGGENPTFGAAEPFIVDGKPFRLMAGEKGSIQGPAERKFGYTAPVVADWDGDGILDIVYNSIWGRIEWLRGKSKGGMELEAPQAVTLYAEGETPGPEWNWWKPEPGTLVTQWRTTPWVCDRNGDGLQDIVMLDPEGYLAYYERFRNDKGELLLKPGKRIFHSLNCSVYDRKKGVVNGSEGLLRLNEVRAGWSGRRKICFMDWDGDGREDLIVDSNNAAWFRNVRETDGEVWYEFMGDLRPWQMQGHSTCPTPIHWRADGKAEILLGAEDGHFYRIKN